MAEQAAVHKGHRLDIKRGQAAQQELENIAGSCMGGARKARADLELKWQREVA